MRDRTSSRSLDLNKSDGDLSRALAHYAQGLIYEEELGKYSSKALEHFIKAAEIDPGRHELHARIATAHLYHDSPEKALEVLEKSCRENPRLFQARIDLAAVCKATGRIDEAIEHYFKALELTPSKTSIYIVLAKLFFQQDKDSRAAGILERGLKKAENTTALLTFCYVIGKQFIDNGETSRSIPCFRLIAAKTSSHRREFHHVLGELYEGLDHDEEAVRNYILATKEDPPLPDSFVKLAFIYFKTDPSKARETLIEADRRLPDDPLILSSLGYLYNVEQQYENAIDAFERIETATASGERKLPANFYLFYGSACERSGRIEKAEEIFTGGLELYPDSHQVLNYLAYMWADKGMKLEEALEYINTALKHDPENGAYIDTLGWIYYKQKKYIKAFEQIERANELIQNDPTIIDHLGDIFNVLNDREKAISYWKRSFLLAPDNETVAEKLKAHKIDVNKLLEDENHPPIRGRIQ